MANIYEVAELAGVSLATVSRVINPGAKVSDKTRQKVLAAMQCAAHEPASSDSRRPLAHLGCRQDLLAVVDPARGHSAMQ